MTASPPPPVPPLVRTLREVREMLERARRPLKHPDSKPPTDGRRRR